MPSLVAISEELEPCDEPMAGDLPPFRRSGILARSLDWAMSSQGGVKVPTGGKGREPEARERLLLPKQGQQIRCDSEADG